MTPTHLFLLVVAAAFAFCAIIFYGKMENAERRVGRLRELLAEREDEPRELMFKVRCDASQAMKELENLTLQARTASAALIAVPQPKPKRSHSKKPQTPKVS